MEFCQLSAGVADSCNAATWFQAGAGAGACVRKARFFRDKACGSGAECNRIVFLVRAGCPFRPLWCGLITSVLSSCNSLAMHVPAERFARRSEVFPYLSTKIFQINES